MIKEIINIIESATNLPVKPLFTNSVEECVVYNYYVNVDDGAKAQNRLEIRLITNTFDNAERYKQKIIQSLVETGDLYEKVNGIYACELNGGGRLYEGATNTFHTLMYFDVITRSNS